MNKVRWWPAIVILVLAVLTIGWVWIGGDQIRQMKVMASLGVTIIAGFLLLVWLTLFSRLAWKRRLLSWVVLLAFVGLFFSAFRFRGVTGDLVPVFQPRWKGEAEALSGEGLTGAVSHSYAQFLGPHRNGTVPGVRLARDWSARPPKLLWRRPVGISWSSFAVAGNVAVTQEQHGEEERVVCYDLKTAEVRWSHSDQAKYGNPLAGDGPRATPTIEDGRVYSYGGTGLLNVLDLESGRRIWSRNVLEENGASVPEWGKSCSPLVIDGLVVVSAGGPHGKSLVAYDKDKGDVVWRAGDDRSSYASPFVTRLAGKRQIVILNAHSVAGHDPEDGRVLWSHPWPGQQPTVAQPVPLDGDRLLVSAGYGIGSKLFEIKSKPSGELEATLVWETPRMKAKFANMVVHDGFVYGFDDGIFTCLEPETGKLRWKRGRYGHGQVLLVGDLLLVQTEKGEILLIEPTPEELRELARFRVMDGKIWNSPALAGPYLLVRTEQEAAMFELPTS